MPRDRTPQRSRPATQYQLMPKLIGKGAYSTVYAAKNTQNGEEVIAKRMDLSKLEDVYNHEIDVMQKLDHENIVKFVSQKRVGYSGYIYMEKVDGLNLYDYVNGNTEKGKGLDVADSVALFVQMASALNHMHNNGISHHDVKTENLVFDQVNNVVKLIDFGLAMYFDGNMVVSPGGSPLYSAPEVLLNQPHHPELSDIWSCAVVFYYMLTGEYPWNDVNNLDELLDRVANIQTPCPNISFPEQVPLELQSLIKQMFSVDPTQRPSFEQCIAMCT